MRLRGPVRLAAAAALACAALGPGSASAVEPIEVQSTVPFQPRSTLLVEPFPLYLTPSDAPTRNPLGTSSMSALRAAAQRTVVADARLAPSERSLLELIVEHNREPQQADLRALAEQNARAGMTSFRQYEMASAIDQLERAADAYRQTGGAFVAAEELADIQFYLALAWLQIGEQFPDRAAEAEVRARAAFAALVRLDPTRLPDPAAFPPHILAPWQEAWAQHLVERGRNLVLTLDEARWLSDRLDRALLIRIVVVGDADDLWLRVQAYDRALDSFVYNEAVPFDPAMAADVVSMSISDIASCLPPLEAADPVARAEWEGDLLVGYSGATFFQAPTRARFFAQGVNLEGSALPGRGVGLYGALRLLFAVRDARGDLVDRLETLQTAVGLRLEHRVRNVRFTGGMGLQIMRSSPVRVSRSFWCRVSGGEPEVFDDERVCLPGDVVDRPASVASGLDLRAGVQVRMGGPMWFSLQADMGFFVIPFEDRVLNVPIGGSASFAYRF